MRVRVLTWNLMHGRSVPGSGRELLAEFAALLSGWEWDLALLQEVPPWWPEPLAQRSGSVEHHVLTSRNGLLPVRRALARRWPDVIKSNGGGCNTILVRGFAVEAHRSRRLSLFPERRWVHAVELGTVWAANLHLQGTVAQARAAAAVAAEWARPKPAILGGDFNVRSLVLPGYALAGGHGVDCLFMRGLAPAAVRTEILDRGQLSDHAPVLVTVEGVQRPG